MVLLLLVGITTLLLVPARPIPSTDATETATTSLLNRIARITVGSSRVPMEDRLVVLDLQVGAQFYVR